MALGSAGRTRWDQVVATIREAETARAGGVGPEVGVYRFGSRLSAVAAPFWRGPAPPTAPAAAPSGRPPAPTDADTLLTGSLENLAGRFGQAPPRAVVVFSDGRAHDPERARAIARGYGRMKIPIHVVPAGSDAAGGDVAIVSMVAPNLVRKSTQIPVQLFLRSYGYNGQRAEVKLAAVNPDGRPARSWPGSRSSSRTAWPATRWPTTRASRISGSPPPSTPSPARSRSTTTPSPPTSPSTTPRSASSTSRAPTSGSSPARGSSGSAGARSRGRTRPSSRP